MYNFFFNNCKRQLLQFIIFLCHVQNSVLTEFKTAVLTLQPWVNTLNAFFFFFKLYLSYTANKQQTFYHCLETKTFSLIWNFDFATQKAQQSSSGKLYLWQNDILKKVRKKTAGFSYNLKGSKLQPLSLIQSIDHLLKSLDVCLMAIRVRKRAADLFLAFLL